MAATDKTKTPVDSKDEPEAGSEALEAEDRAAILRRRAMLIASAVAGLGLVASCDGDPRPCLSIVEVPSQGTTTTEPQPCLMPTRSASADPGASDAGTGEGDDAGDAGEDASNDAAAPAQTKPLVKPPPTRTPPMPCLSPVRPPKREGF